MQKENSPRIKNLVKEVIGEYEQQVPLHRVDPQIYVGHCKMLESLKWRTMRIELMAAVIIIMTGIFGTVICIIEYSSKKIDRAASAQESYNVANLKGIQKNIP
ncbi:MAG: hypothetical protein WCS96_00775 [Victivallales bacterium]